MSSLPLAPETPFDSDGNVRWGTYRGSCRNTDLSERVARAGTGAGRRFIREKRWQWFGAATPSVVCGGTLFDAGYATSVFLWVFDREAGRLLVDDRDLLPPFAVEVSDNPGAGGGAHLRGLSRHVDFDREEGRALLEVESASVEMHLEFATDVLEPVTAVCPIGEDENVGMNVTQKQTCLPVDGRITAEGRTFTFGEGLGMLDYTHGLLGRETTWTWVMGCSVLEDGTRVGVNVCEAFNDHRENVAWLGDRLQELGATRIDFDGDRPRDPWTIRSSDGRLDLSLVAEGLRRHNTDLQVVSSSRLEPIGRVHGRIIDREVHDLFAVGECHRARW